MRYSHRLVGHVPAAEWSAFTSDNKVSYRNVSAGEFRFEVRALDWDGLLSDIASLDVRVDPDEQNGSRALGAERTRPESGHDPVLGKGWTGG